MWRGVRETIAALVIAALAVAVSRQAPAQTDRARQLFDAGREALKKGAIRRACELFWDSQIREPSPGTLLNLGDCEHKLGLNASAWYKFTAAAQMAKQRYPLAAPEEQPRLLAVIREGEKRAGELWPMLARLRVQVPEAVPELRVHVGLAILQDAEIGREVPHDPGNLEISAEAPGYRRWSRTMALRSNESQTLEIPRLEKLPTAR